MAYIVLGHASEKRQRPTVPPGSMLVLTEECGMSSVFPHFIYPALADPSMTALFADPVRNKAAIESLFRRPIRIYVAGATYPELSYTLLSDIEEQYAPSGFYALPTPSFVFQSQKRGEVRYMTSDPAKASTGSLVEGQVTQSALFSRYPGVHYSLLCRRIDEEDRLRALISQHFPTQKPFGPETYDPFETAAIWMSDVRVKNEAQRAALTEIQQIVDDVMERRRSGSPLGDQTVMSMLAMRTLPAAALQAIADMPDVDRAERRTGYTPLMMATLMGHRSAVSALLKRGANVNARDNEGATALLFVKDPGIAMMLLKSEPDLNLASEDGVTVTHVLAANHSMAHVLRLAIAKGANPTVTDDEGDTPLHVAATAEIVEMLVAAGADPNRQNADGKTPLLTTMEEGDMEAAAALIPITTTGLQEALKEAINAKQDEMAVALIAAGAPVHSWKRVAEAAKRFGLRRLEVVARERGRRRRYTVKKSSR